MGMGRKDKRIRPPGWLADWPRCPSPFPSPFPSPGSCVRPGTGSVGGRYFSGCSGDNRRVGVP